MREIKFRVWHKKYKKWLTDNDYGTHASSNWMMDVFTGKIIDFVDDNNSYSPTFYPNYYMDAHCIIDESPFGVQQYTGLKDANGVDIYEGDIVKIIYDKAIGEVYFDSNLGAFRLKDKSGKSYPITTYRFDETNKPIGLINVADEVVGNIFENPELLKQ